MIVIVLIMIIIMIIIIIHIYCIVGATPFVASASFVVIDFFNFTGTKRNGFLLKHGHDGNATINATTVPIAHV